MGTGVIQLGRRVRVAAASDRAMLRAGAGRTDRGGELSDIARETGRSVNTVRWHLRHIYTKPGLSRQAEVVRAVKALAGVAGARR